MTISTVAAQMSKCISAGNTLTGRTWICRSFVAATRPSEKKLLDKETCEKVKQAAKAVAEGAKEVRQTGQSIKEALTPNAGKIVSDIASKVIEKASDASDETEEKKDTTEKVTEESK